MQLRKSPNTSIFLRQLVVAFCAVTVLCDDGVGQTFDEQFDHWPVQTRINGTVCFATGLEGVESLRDALQQMGRDRDLTVLVCGEQRDAITEDYAAAFDEADVRPAESVGDLCSECSEILDDAKVCCLHFDGALSDADLKAVLRLKPALTEFVDRGRALVVIGRPALSLGRFCGGSSTDNEFTAGLNLLPDTIIRTADGDASERGLLNALQTRPRMVGVLVEPETIVVQNKRRVRVFGDGGATFLIPARGATPAKIQTIKRQTSRRQSPEEYLIDLTQWRRIAIERTLPEFPPKERQMPFVENGTLIIVGGGGMPEGLMSRMVELAGGVDEAHMIYVPCSEESRLPPRQRIVDQWKRMGVKHATFIHTKDRNRANDDEEFLKPLREATGIWFGGGRQWSFSDSYYGTTAHKLMKEVLNRGGVIGGSSAGASIQAQYLARATPIENFRIMAPGYERGGLGFISGVAIDQHFTQRGRQKDMTQLVNRYPQLLGIGIDESTALIVQKSSAQVTGDGDVYFYDRQKTSGERSAEFVALPSGSEYDLSRRAVVKVGPPTTIAPLIERIAKATVQIVSTGELSTGVVISPDGHVLTVNHGLAESADRVKVFDFNQELRSAIVVARNRERDVALLKIEASGQEKLPSLLLGNPQLSLSERVVALGYPARDGSGVSAVTRLGRLVSHDRSALRSSCALTAGDSGGPLVSLDGQLLGIHQRIGIGRNANLHLSSAACREALIDTVDPKELSPAALRPMPLVGRIEVAASVLSRCQKATVYIVNDKDDVVACGTILNSNTIVTKFSELDATNEVRCRTFDNRIVTAKVVKSDRGMDLAVLHLATTIPDAAGPLKTGPLRVGTLLFAMDADSIGVCSRVGHQEKSSSPRLGCTLVVNDNALVVEKVAAQGAAIDAGLRPQDRLRRLADTPLRDLSDVADALKLLEPGDRVRFEFFRDGQSQTKWGRLQHRASEMLQRTEFLDGRTGDLSLRRTGFVDVIQHDCSRAAAQMGGPLFTIDGRLAGINIARRAREAVLAIPIERVMKVVASRSL